MTPKKIFPIVLVKAIGRNSAGSDVLEDFASSWMQTLAHSSGISLEDQIFANNWTRIEARATLVRHI